MSAMGGQRTLVRRLQIAAIGEDFRYRRAIWRDAHSNPLADGPLARNIPFARLEQLEHCAVHVLRGSAAIHRRFNGAPTRVKADTNGGVRREHRVEQPSVGLSNLSHHQSEREKSTPRHAPIIHGGQLMSAVGGKRP